jgi:hypothetical protein
LYKCYSLVSNIHVFVLTEFNVVIHVVFLLYRPVNDNRASLLRGSTTVKKPVNERDIYMHVWKNYVTFAFRVVPPVPSPIVRCASPDLSLRYVLISMSGIIRYRKGI